MVICPNCGLDITETEFSCDSNYPGTIDIGYECDDCGITVYTYKVERTGDVQS